MRLSDLASFCWAGQDYFDRLSQVDDSSTRYPFPTDLDRACWQCTESGVWVHVRPVPATLPAQGWKVHVASVVDDARKVLDIVWHYCLQRHIAFKFVRSETLFLVTNGKTFPRQASGKMMALYPSDEHELERVLGELGPVLAPFQGPYILSDLRHRDGPLYVRYGAFEPLWSTTADGERVPALMAPDGRPVPDVRGVRFSPPAWVAVPAILQPDLLARQERVAEAFPYRISRAVKFSNCGGVYAGVDESNGAPVIIREARPHAGLDLAGHDAVFRLLREKRVLERLAGLDCVPALVDHRVVRGHHYLVEEYLDGPTMLQWMLGRLPLSTPSTAAARAGYLRQASHLIAEVERALSAVHGRGVWYGDVHPNNIIVRPGGGAAFVDFEFAEVDAGVDGGGAVAGRLAGPLAGPGRVTAAAPGFTPPPGLTGPAADLFCLDRLLLTALLPLTGLVEHDPAKAATLAEVVTAQFVVDDGLRGRLRRHAEQSGGLRPDPANALFDGLPTRSDAVRDALARAIIASATPERADRLFPGDPAQFDTAGIDVASGAAGVLYALWRTGAPVPGELVDWLGDTAVAAAAPRAGLLTGLPGVALVLDLLGRRAQALQLADRVVGHETPAVGLQAGRAGSAAALLALARRTGEGRLLDRAVELTDSLAGLVAGGAGLAGGPGEPELDAGLTRGWTGVAALFLQLFDLTAQGRYLDLARTCLQRDLDRCAPQAPGTCYVVEGRRYLPYLDSGSIGIATIMARYLRRRDDAAFRATVAAASHACDVEFCYLAGLFGGRAGVILALASIGDSQAEAVLMRHVRRLGWHALSRGAGIVFPGAHNVRLSMDLGTGTAGVLLAVHAAVVRDGAFLPGLED